MVVVQPVSIIATVGFALMTMYQLLLAAGLPIGKAAWGGQYVVLPVKLRWASLCSALVFIYFMFNVLAQAGYIREFINQPIADYTLWAFTGLLGLSTLGNFMSQSKLEKIVMTPIALILFLSCLLISVYG